MPMRHRAGTRGPVQGTSASSRSSSESAEDQATRSSPVPVQRVVSPTPVLDAAMVGAAEAGLGVDLGDLEVSAGGEAEARGAAATARDGRISFHPDTLDDDGSVDPELFFHEAAHLAQQDGAGTADAGANFEGEAHAAADRLMSGGTAQVSSTGSQRPAQDWLLDDWWRATFGGPTSTVEEDAAAGTTTTTRTEGLPATPSHTREVETDKAERTAIRHGDTVLTDADGKPRERITGGSTGTASTTSGVGSGSSSASETTYATGDDGVTTASTEGSSSSWNLWDMVASWGSESASKETKVSTPADVVTPVRTTLEGRRAGLLQHQGSLDAELAALDARTATHRTEEAAHLARIRGTLASDTHTPTDEEVRAAAARDPGLVALREEARLVADDRRRVTSERATVRGAITQLDADLAALTPETAAAIANRTGASTGIGETTSRSSSDKTTYTVDGSLESGSVTATGTREQTRTEGDSTTTETGSSAHSLAVDKGVSYARTDSGSIKTEEGRESAALSGSSTTTTGLAARGDGEYGATRSRSRTSKAEASQADGEHGTESGSTSRTDSSSTTVTTHGVYREDATERRASVGYKHEDKENGEHLAIGAEGGVKTSTSGAFTVHVDPVKDKSPPMWDLVVKIKAGGGISGDGKATGSHAGASSSIGVSGGASGSATMTFTHRMGAHEAETYLGELEAAEAGAAAGELPEFGILQRMEALAMNGDNAAIGAAALVSSEAATALAPGDSVQLELAGAANLGVNGALTAGGVGLTAGTSSSWDTSRKIKVSRAKDADGRDVVELTVTLMDKDSGTIKAGGTYEGVSMGASITSGTTDGLSSTFRLDPAAADYGEVYGDILGSFTREDLKDAETKYAAHAWSHTDTTGNSSGLGLEASGFGLAVAGSHTRSMTDAVTHGHRKDGSEVLTAEFTGENKGEASVKVGGVTVGGDSITTRSTAAVDEDGALAIELDQTDTDTRLFGVRDGAAETSTSEDDSVTLESTLVDGPRAALERALTETFSTLTTYRIDQRSFDALVARAADRPRWLRCSEFFVDPALAWADLRGVLLATPSAEDYPQYAGADARRLANLVHGRALVAYMAAYGDDAFTIVGNALRAWGEGINHTEGGAEDLALFLQWPDSISGSSAEFDALQRISDGLPDHLMEEEDQARGNEYLGNVEERITALYAVVDGCADFDERRAKLEMLDVIGGWRTALITERANWAAAMSGSPDATIGAMVAQHEIARLTRLLADYKLEERRAFQQMTDARTTTGVMDFFFGESEYDALIDVGSDLRDMYELWIAKILELRQAYTTAATPVAEWKVSRDASGEGRNPGLEPAATEYAAIWRQFIETGVDQHNLEERHLAQIDRYTHY